MIQATTLKGLPKQLGTLGFKLAHSSAALLGVVVIGLASVQVARHGTEGLQPARWAADYGLLPSQAEESADTVPVSNVTIPTMDGVIRYLSQKYRVSRTAVTPLVEAAHETGRSMGVDPLLILAVMAIESRFNPFAESSFGAQGLMQVVPRFHHDKLEDGEDVTAFLDPETNIRVGAQILKDSIKRAGGSVKGGLQRYNGNLSDPNQRYANKVMAEKARLSQALAQNHRLPRANLGA